MTWTRVVVFRDAFTILVLSSPDCESAAGATLGLCAGGNAGAIQGVFAVTVFAEQHRLYLFYKHFWIGALCEAEVLATGGCCQPFQVVGVLECNVMYRGIRPQLALRQAFPYSVDWLPDGGHEW